MTSDRYPRLPREPKAVLAGFAAFLLLGAALGLLFGAPIWSCQ